LAAQFIEHALALAPTVMMLLRLGFLEGGNRNDISGRARRAVLDHGKLARVHVFKNRLPMIHRDGWAGPRAKSSAVAFAWFVWDRFHSGSTKLNRISWEPEIKEAT